MIWLFIIVPIAILIGITIFWDKKNKGMNHPPDVNKGNKNIESETTRNQFNQYNNHGGGSDGGGSN
ncbi:hypothetical protein AB685_15675 [Bacillus sp. LL01]|uniref:hypothetical protein n=1 Tax=Bacillus sp. LL01 TaxID=1665556 RepID=UPI00064CFD7F|nr:hypothetical protein [Bacillus sp. LL01]KMJ57455.1 hypothetical protein AB685_15675 [Bacillus sp. LL01]